MHRRRAEVLAVLQRTDAALSVRQVAEETGLPVNTARFHLDGLVTTGQAHRTHEKRSTPGRPSVLYEASEKDPGPRSYRLLAEMLTSLVANLADSTARATEAGRAWGRHLVERTDPLERVDADIALIRLNAMLDAVGFDPELRHHEQDGHDSNKERAEQDSAHGRGAHTDGTHHSDGDGTRPDGRPNDGQIELRLHHCPFLEVAEAHQEVVCAMHLGLMQGAVTELGAALHVDSLIPFATDEMCTSRLSTRKPH